MKVIIRVETTTDWGASDTVELNRMCKRQQMRWSPPGAHLLARVRCAVVNGDLHERLAVFRRRMGRYLLRPLHFLTN